MECRFASVGIDIARLSRGLLGVSSQRLLYENIWLKRRGGIGVSHDDVTKRRIRYHRGQVLTKTLIEPKEAIAASECFKLVRDDCLKGWTHDGAGGVPLC